MGGLLARRSGGWSVSYLLEEGEVVGATPSNRNTTSTQ